MTTLTPTPQYQVNLDSENGTTAIHVDSKETLERIESFKANLDASKAKTMAEDDEEYDDEDEMDEEDEMPAAKGKKMPFWMKKKDSADVLERHDSETLRAYLDSDDEDEIAEFEEGDDLEEVVDSLIEVIQRYDNKLAVAAELLSRQDSGAEVDIEDEIQSRVDSVLTAFFDAAKYLPQGFAYADGMTGGDVYAEAIAHIDSDFADEIDVENADDATLQAAFKALSRGKTDSRVKSQNQQISEALNGSRADSVPTHISRLDAEDPNLAPWQRQQIRDYQASRAPIN